MDGKIEALVQRTFESILAKDARLEGALDDIRVTILCFWEVRNGPPVRLLAA